MKTLDIQAAKKHLARLVDEAVAGEEIVLAKAGRPLVRLVPFRAARAKRKLGLMKGRIKEAPGCWDSDLTMEGEFDEGPALG